MPVKMSSQNPSHVPDYSHNQLYLSKPSRNPPSTLNGQEASIGKQEESDGNPTLFDKFGGESNLRKLVDNWFATSSKFQADKYANLSDYNLRKEKYVQFLKTMMDDQKFYVGQKLQKVHLD